MRWRPTSKPNMWTGVLSVGRQTRSCGTRLCLWANRRRGWAVALSTCPQDRHHPPRNSDLVQMPLDSQVSRKKQAQPLVHGSCYLWLFPCLWINQQTADLQIKMNNRTHRYFIHLDDVCSHSPFCLGWVVVHFDLFYETRQDNLITWFTNLKKVFRGFGCFC